MDVREWKCLRNVTLLAVYHIRIIDSENLASGPAGPLVILSFYHSVIVRLCFLGTFASFFAKPLR